MTLWWTVGRRLLAAAATVLAASALLFTASEVLPGDAATSALGSSATAQQIAAYRERLDLDADPLSRYKRWIGHAATGDLGTSTVSGNPVASTIARPLRDSLLLAGVAAAVTIALSLGLGLLAGTRPGSRRDVALSSAAMVLVAIPQFVTAVGLVALFASLLHVLPAVSLVPPGGTPLDDPQILVLPALALVAFGVGWATRLVRAAVADANAAPNVEAARLAGLSERRVVLRHLLPGALGPCAHTFAWLTSFMLGGTAIVEKAFNYPGMSAVLIGAVKDHDTPTLEALGLVLAAIVTGAFLLADLIVLACNPRLRTSR